MSGKSIKFDGEKINKSNFYKNKKLFNLHDTDVNKILVSKKESYDTKNSIKYFIGYNDDDDVIRPLCINLLLKKYNKIWEKISNLINIEIDNEPVYGNGDKYIKTKIKMYEDRVNKNFPGKKVPKENASYKCLLIMLDSVIRVNKKHYSQTHLEECKYAIRNNKMENLINDDLDLSSSDESDNETDNESDNDSDSETDN